MSPTELDRAIHGYYAGAPADAAASLPWDPRSLRAIVDALAELGQVPAGCEALAFRILFDNLAWIQDTLPPGRTQALEALMVRLGNHALGGLDRALEGAPAAGQRTPEASGDGVIRGVGEAAPGARPPPARVERGGPGLMEWGIGMGVICIIMVAGLNTTGGNVNNLLQKVANSLSTVGDGVPEAGMEPRLSIDRGAGGTYRPGDTLRLDVGVVGGGYLYAFAIGPAGHMRVLEGGRGVRTGETVSMTTRAQGPTGRATLLVAIAQRPVAGVGSPILEASAGAADLARRVEAAARAAGAWVIIGTVAYEVTTPQGPPPR